MKVRVADYIARFLTDNGITDTFMVVGGGAMHLDDALGRNEEMHCVFNHHEQACAIAAEAYARLTGRIAAICVTSGPGGTNAITGVLGGWLDSIPMFVLSGQVKFSTTIKSTDVPLRQLGDQEFNITDCISTMTKYSCMVTDPESIAYHLEKALYIATHGRPGPVWLDVPLNVQGAKVDPASLAHYDAAEDAAMLPPEPDGALIDELLDRLASAKRPVILAGGGIRTGHAYDEFMAAIEELKVPVCTAWNAHDLLPDENPYYAGRPGTVGTRGGNFVMQNADLIVSFACRMNVRQIGYEWDKYAPRAFKAYIDIDQAELDKPSLDIGLKIHADIKPSLAMIAERARKRGMPEHRDWLDWCRAIDRKYPAVLPEYKEEKSPINPYWFMETLSKHLPEGQVTACGNGSACVCSFQAFHIKPGQRLFTNSGCASMGYGTPAAVGCAVALHGKPVVCLDGDGSIQMNIQELQTIVHNKLDIKLFWLNNDGYHSIRQTQTNTFGGFFVGINDESGISFPDAERIAYAYGLPFRRIADADAMDEQIEDVLAQPGGVLCEVMLDKTQFFAPKTSSKVLEDGTIVSPPLEDMYPFLPEEEMKQNRLN